MTWRRGCADIKDNLATVVFQQPPTAHAISPVTVGPERQDIVVGLETGDLVYLDFINDRTERFNIAVSGLWCGCACDAMEKCRSRCERRHRHGGSHRAEPTGRQDEPKWAQTGTTRRRGAQTLTHRAR